MATQSSSQTDPEYVKFYKTTCFLHLMSGMKKKGRATVRLKDTRDISTKFSVWALLGPTLNKM